MKKNRKKASLRNKNGSLLLFMLGILALLLAAMCLSFSVLAMFVTHQQLQQQAENTVLRIAKQFNNADRVGRINNLTAASRELVFNSRSAFDDTDARNRDFKPLAMLYLDEARRGADMVSTDYKALLAASLHEAQSEAKDSNDKHLIELSLPWVNVQNYKVVNLDVGYVRDGKSNVTAPVGNRELYEFDKQSKLIDGQSNLYFGNRLLKLPGSDADLDFRISVLQSPVQNITETARLTLAEDVMITKRIVEKGSPTDKTLDFIPSVAQARMEVELKNLQSGAISALKTDVTAIGQGASLLPQISIEVPK